MAQNCLEVVTQNYQAAKTGRLLTPQTNQAAMSDFLTYWVGSQFDQDFLAVAKQRSCCFRHLWKDSACWCSYLKQPVAVFEQSGRRGSVGKSAVLTPLGMLELVVQSPLLPGMSMCTFLYWPPVRSSKYVQRPEQHGYGKAELCPCSTSPKSENNGLVTHCSATISCIQSATITYPPSIHCSHTSQDSDTHDLCNSMQCIYQI